MRATLAGRGVRDALERGERGVVLASFRLACYVAVGDGLVALVAPGVHPGPVHLILDAPPPRPSPGAGVEIARGGLFVGEEWIGTAGARTWSGSLPPAESVAGSAEAIARAASGSADRSPLLAAPFHDAASAARELLDEGRLTEAGRLLAGLGPGLTPSGDDALAGIVFALRASRGPDAEPEASDLAGLVTSGPLSRAFGLWAARGQALAPAHELVRAAVAGDDISASSSAWALAAIGETSGSDFLLGLIWGLAASSPQGGHRVVASPGSSSSSR